MAGRPRSLALKNSGSSTIKWDPTPARIRGGRLLYGTGTVASIPYLIISILEGRWLKAEWIHTPSPTRDYNDSYTTPGRWDYSLDTVYIRYPTGVLSPRVGRLGTPYSETASFSIFIPKTSTFEDKARLVEQRWSEILKKLPALPAAKNNPNCFQLVRKSDPGAGPVVLNRLDEEICALVGDPVHPRSYCRGWFDSIGFDLSMGKKWTQIRAEIVERNADDKRAGYYNPDFDLLPILDYLEKNFTVSAWCERN